MSLKNSSEVLNQNSEETMIKVSDLKKRGLDIADDFISKHGERLIAESKIPELLKKSSEERLNALSGLLGLKHEIKSNAEEGAKRVIDAVRITNLEQIEDGKKADSLLETIDEATISIQNSPTTQNLKDGAIEMGDKLKEGAKTVKENAGLAKFFEWFVGLFKKFLGLFGLNKFFGLDKLENIGEVLSKEQIEETRIKLKEKLEPSISKFKEILPNHPVIQQNFETAINNPEIFSNDIITKIKKLLDSGEEINLKTLSSVLTGEEKLKLEKAIFTPEAKKALEQQAEAKIVDIIQKEYNLRVNSEKRAELIKLIQETRNDISYIELGYSFIEGNVVDGFDIIGASIGTGIGMFWFAIKLVTKGIIGAGDLALNIKDSGIKTVELSLGKLGLSSVTYQDFEKQIENMNESEKGLLLGVLYRKTGLFAKTLGAISAYTTKMTVGLITPTSVDFVSSLKSGVKGDIKSKIDNFERISKSLGGTNNDTIKLAYEKLNEVIKNTQIIEIINSGEKAGNSAAQIKQNLLKNNLISLADDIPIDSIPKLRESISSKINKIVFTPNIGEKIAKFYPGLTNSIQDFYTKLGVISDYQKSNIKLGKGFIETTGNILKSHANLIEEIRLSRSADKLLFEGLSKTEALTKTQALRKFAHDLPDLFKHTLGGITEIAFIGLSLSTMKQGDSVLETIINDLLYMSGFLGPLLLTLNVGALYDKDSKNIQWLNVAQAGAGGVFLAMDGLELAKILGTSGSINEVGVKIGNLILRPVTSSYKAIAHLVKGGQDIFQIAKANGQMPWKEILEKSAGAFKRKKGKLGLALGLIAVGTILTINYLKVDLSKEFEELIAKGIIDEHGNIINEDLAREYFNTELSEREKEALVEILFIQDENKLIEPSGNLEFIISGKDILISTNQGHIGNWVITPQVKNKLQLIGIQNIRFENTYQKPA